MKRSPHTLDQALAIIFVASLVLAGLAMVVIAASQAWDTVAASDAQEVR